MVSNKNTKSAVRHILKTVLLILLMLGISVMLAGMLLYQVLDAEHYNRVYQNPLTVTATVTKHGSYDDEGDTDYKSYITYTVNGVKYSNKTYEDRETKSDLTPIGTEVSVDVSPEDPAVQIAELISSGRGLSFFIIVFSLFLSAVWNVAIGSRRSTNSRCRPDQETIQRDVLLTICSRMSTPFWLILSVGYFLLRWRYPALIKSWTIAVGAVCGVIWLLFMYHAIRQIRQVRNGDYSLRRDVLTEKEYIPDSEGDTYKLHYQSDEGTWDKNVSRKQYETAKKGDTVYAVYLPGKKRPIIHYDSHCTAD